MCLCSAASSLTVWCHQASSGKHVRRPLKSCGGSRASRFSVRSRYRLAKFRLCHADAETNKDQWDVQSFLNLIFSPWGKKIGSSLAHRCWRDPKMLVMSISGNLIKKEKESLCVWVCVCSAVRPCVCVCVCMCLCAAAAIPQLITSYFQLEKKGKFYRFLRSARLLFLTCASIRLSGGQISVVVVKS